MPENVDWQYVAYPACIVVALLVIWSLIDCWECTQLSSEVASEAASQVAAAVADSSVEGSADLTGLRKDDTQLQKVKVYVDRSLSMMPYLGTRRDADFLRLLDRLGNFVGSETEFYGFGYKSANDEQQTVAPISPIQLRDPSAYRFKNNDYGSLLDQLTKGEATNLVVTDGVQSDPETKAQLGKVLSAIDQWVRSGGTFATLFHRTTYDGQYYSDLPGEDPKYSCADRPLTTFALGQSPSAVNDLLDRFGKELRPDHMVRLGENPLPIRPVERTVANDGRRGRRVFRSTEKYVLEQFDQVYQAPVASSSIGTDGFAPLQFRATIDLESFPWTALDQNEITSFLEALEPQVDGFVLNRAAIEKINQPDRQRQASVAPPQSEQGTKPLLERTSVQTRQMPAPVVNTDGDSVRAQFTIPVRRPEASGRSTRFAFLVRFETSPQGARMLVPESYTTNNDLDPSSCDKVLNIQQLVGTVMHRNYAPGQALLLSEWQ